jgi:hypothetical protein
MRVLGSLGSLHASRRLLHNSQPVEAAMRIASADEAVQQSCAAGGMEGVQIAPLQCAPVSTESTCTAAPVPLTRRGS